MAGEDKEVQVERQACEQEVERDVDRRLGDDVQVVEDQDSGSVAAMVSFSSAPHICDRPCWSHAESSAVALPRRAHVRADSQAAGDETLLDELTGQRIS